MTSSTLPIETVLAGGDVIALVSSERWDVPPQLAYANGWNDAHVAALAAAPPASSLVEVKGLVWEAYATDGSTQKAKTDIGYYVVWEIGGDGFLCLTEGRPGFRVAGGISAAKALAQEKFAARVTSCLTASAGPTDAATERDRIVTIIRGYLNEPGEGEVWIVRQILGAIERDDGEPGYWQDKAEGLEADLNNAVEVAFKRGAAEWTRKNYPAHFARLSAQSSVEAVEASSGSIWSDLGIPEPTPAEAYALGAKHAQNASADPAEPAQSLALEDATALLQWVASDKSLSLQWGSTDRSDECAPYLWLVHRERGNINDREWDLVGIGKTPVAALTAARAALSEAKP